MTTTTHWAAIVSEVTVEAARNGELVLDDIRIAGRPC